MKVFMVNIFFDSKTAIVIIKSVAATIRYDLHEAVSLSRVQLSMTGADSHRAALWQRLISIWWSESKIVYYSNYLLPNIKIDGFNGVL